MEAQRTQEQTYKMVVREEKINRFNRLREV